MEPEKAVSPRRRRRSEPAEETAEETTAVFQAAEEEPAAETAEEKAEETREVPAAQGADSRVPPEARRMSALPYGEDAGSALRRPGTRPMTVPPRPAREPVRGWETRRPVRPAKSEDGEATRAFPAPRNSDGGIREDGTRRIESARNTGNEARVSVGYAPGRMNLNPRTAQEYVQDIRSAQEYGQAPQDPRDPRLSRNGGAGRHTAELQPVRQPKRKTGLWILTAILLLAGLALIVVMGLPEENAIRMRAAEIAEKVAEPAKSLLGARTEVPAQIRAFTVTGSDLTAAPADVIFSVTTDNTVRELRLADEDDAALEAETTLAENAESNLWTLTFRVRDGYEGLVKLQTRKAGGEWEDTEYSAELAIAPPVNATASPAQSENGESGAEEAQNGQEPGRNTAEEDPETEEETGTEEGTAPEEEEQTEDPEQPEQEEQPEDPEQQENGDQPEDYGDDLWGVAWGETGGAPAEETPSATPAPTDTPEPTPEPTPTPPLTAEADPAVGADLITTTIVYDGSKKVKDYVRPAKSLIHMPAGDDYTVRKIGVLTFRGNAFRQNAAVGEITSAEELSLLWTAEAGSSRGATETFYGYMWPGQPAIVKWSTQVRAASNIDEDKKTKTALREVIIAGVDGVIRFLDLEDGTYTRDAVTLGYPMKGSPSLHPSGYPYMNVGQYTRKMKNKTGTIGLRQYNLYSQKQLGLIDGLDGKLHRGIYRFGSFETSALIDRTSDTVVTLGTNGLLYLISLNTSFDYQVGTLSTSPSTIVMSARAKNEKKNERVAVESSHAMYDRYVFYADMGGVLRCVDTNYLKPVWAVETGDSVLSAVALDLHDEDKLDLYTANMLSIRSKGNAQIRKYNALSGTELWTVEIGVSKNTKTKEDVGVKASPVIGQNSLADLVYYTVTGLNEDGRATLDITTESKAALVALEKETGKIRWAKGLSDRSESSPVAVYDPEGNGWIIQCVEDGTVLLMDGLTGDVKAELQIDAKIQASPAVYNDILVVGTTGKGTEMVCGIKIK